MPDAAKAAPCCAHPKCLGGSLCCCRSAEKDAARREGYLIALHLWHEADPDHCGGECFRESDIQAALTRVFRPPRPGVRPMPEHPLPSAENGLLRPEGCICPMFRDTGGFRIADLCCPVHGVNGTDPGDGYWERVTPPAETGGASDA